MSHSNCCGNHNWILKTMYLWPCDDIYGNIPPSAQRAWSLQPTFQSMLILNVSLLDWEQHFRIFYRNGKLSNLPVVVCSEHFHSSLLKKNFLLLPKNEKKTKSYCKVLLTTQKQILCRGWSIWFFGFRVFFF